MSCKGHRRRLHTDCDFSNATTAGHSKLVTSTQTLAEKSSTNSVFTSRNETRISHRSNLSYKKTVYIWTFWASLFFSVKEKAICKHSSIMSSQRRRKFLEAYRRSLPSRIIFILQKTLSQCYRTDLPVYSRDLDITLYGLPSS